MPADTLDQIYRPLMGFAGARLDRCAVCGRAAPLEQHHVVWRSWGEVFFRNGRAAPKPTLTLCGFGNNLRDADGRYYCHGLAHHRMLHFRMGPDGALEYLRTKAPTRYEEALGMDGWREAWTARDT